MRSKWVNISVMIVCMCLLCGCWDIKTVQDINYITALGLDYKDGKYLIYTQLLDFSNVAKQEGGKPDKPVPITVGQASGHNLGEAFSNLYSSTQQLTFWGHVSAILISERLIQQGLSKEQFDLLIRFREIRYTQWIYATKDPIDKILVAKPLFNLSALSSILHQPEGSNNQHSIIKPIEFHTFLNRLREPGATLLIPSLTTTSTNWEQDQKPTPQLEMNGVFAIYKGKEMGWFSRESLKGLRWLEEGTAQTSLVVSNDHKGAATINFANPRVKWITTIKDGIPEFDVEVHLIGDISEVVDPSIFSELRDRAMKEIRNEIESTFSKGAQKKADLYQLEHNLYLHHFGVWSALTDNGQKPFSPLSLRSIKIDLFLGQSGMYRIPRVRNEY